MAFQLPSVKPRGAMPGSFQFHEDGSGLGNIMSHPMTARAQIAPQHPLESALKMASLHDEALQRSTLLLAQGPSGPMIHAMELRAANSIGRLPFLQGSNLQHDVLTGKDEEIDFDDVFGVMPRFSERSVHPHTVMESLDHKLSF